MAKKNAGELKKFADNIEAKRKRAEERKANARDNREHFKKVEAKYNDKITPLQAQEQKIKSQRPKTKEEIIERGRALKANHDAQRAVIAEMNNSLKSKK